MSPSTPRSRCLTLVLLLALPACKGTDPAFLTAEGRRISEVAAIPYRIALAPVALGAGVELGTVNDGLRFSLSGAELQLRLVKELERQNTATEVFAVGEADVAEARQQRADLLIRPRLTGLRVAHHGAGEDALLSSFLWLGTWAGGMFCGDARYDARLEVEWSMVNPFDNREIDRTIASSEQADLSFFDRNSPFSLQLLQTLILPPVWTSDDARRTSASLSALATARVAARLANHLKHGFVREAQQVVGELRLDSPRNHASVPLPPQLRGRVIAREPITAVRIYVNDQPVLVLKDQDLPAAVEQSRGSTYQVNLDHRLTLRPGTNQVAIEFAVRGNFSSRTLTLQAQGLEQENQS